MYRQFCYLIVDWPGKAVMEPVLYRGKDVIDTFLRKLLDDVAGLNRRLNKSLIMSHNVERDFSNATTCYLCKQALSEKVRNHCHITGRYLGAAHYACNLNFKIPYNEPVFL